MGFTPASIVAPNVPDKLDPLTFLTSTPRSKVQEQAQEQAQALGRASLRGMSPQEIEQLVLGPVGPRKSDMPEFSREEIATFQDKKTTSVPTQIQDKLPPSSVSVDYPFLFVNARSRLAYSYMSVAVSGEPRCANDHPDRVSRAPVIELSLDEFNHFDASTVEKHRNILDSAGIVKFKLAKGSQATVRVPFNQDYTGFKVQNQYFLNSDTKMDYRNTKRGFFRALIRFHTSYGGMSTADSGAAMANAGSGGATGDEAAKKRRLVRFPTFERRAIDFFRMFHIVELRGGMNEVVRRKEWAQVGRELGYSSTILPTLSTTMRNVYMKVLYPFSQWLKLHADMDMKLIPQLDVADDAAKMAELVRSTSGSKHSKASGNSKSTNHETHGWKRLSYGIVVYTRVRPTDLSTRKIETVDAQKTSCFTLRSYKSQIETLSREKEKLSQEKQAPGLPAPSAVIDLEKEFKSLPEFYQVEVVSPSIKLHSFPPYVAFPDDAKDLGSRGDFGDISSLPVRNQGATWPSLISDDMDDIIVPQIEAGSQFSASKWDKPPAETYHVSLIIEGAPSTWYVKTGARTGEKTNDHDIEFVDQLPGEVLVISPRVKSMRWRHEYNASVECNLMLPQSWLVTSVLNGADATKFVNLQSLVHDICVNPTEGLDETVKTQTLEALRILRERELNYVREIHGKIPSLVVPSVKITSASGHKLLYSHVRMEGAILTCEEYLSLPEPSDAEFCTVYGTSPENYFSVLESKLAEKPVKNSRDQGVWLDAVGRILAQNTKFPSQKQIDIMRGSIPSQSISTSPLLDHLTLIRLTQLTQNLGKWLELSESERIEKVRLLVETTDDDQVETFVSRLQSESKKYTELWSMLETALNSNRVVDSLLAATTQFLNDPQFRLAASEADIMFLMKVQTLSSWIVRATNLTRPKLYAGMSSLPIDNSAPITDEMTALEFRDEGLKLGFPSSSSVVQALNVWIQALGEDNEALHQFVSSVEALDPLRINEVVRRYESRLAYVRPDIRRVLEQLVAHAPLLARMKDSNIRNRPLRSEIAALADLPAIKLSLAELDNWLMQAKQLPWSAIYVQIKAMIEQAPLTEVVPVSRMAIYALYSHIFSLTVLPEDIAQVMTTFEKTIEHFKTQPAAILYQYGFLD